MPFHLKNEFRELFLVQDVPGRLLGKCEWIDSRVLKSKLNKQPGRCLGTSQVFPPCVNCDLLLWKQLFTARCDASLLNESVWCGLSAAGP